MKSHSYSAAPDGLAAIKCCLVQYMVYVWVRVLRLHTYCTSFSARSCLKRLCGEPGKIACNLKESARVDHATACTALDSWDAARISENISYLSMISIVSSLSWLSARKYVIASESISSHSDLPMYGI